MDGSRPGRRRAARPCGLFAVAALGLLLAACGVAAGGEQPDAESRPNVSSVQVMEPAGMSRADQYRATATALAEEAEAARRERAGRQSGDQFSEIFRLLRMPAATQIQIPSLEIDAAVEDVGTEIKNGRLVWTVIGDRVGHHHASANPGEPGNIVLTGHVVSRSGTHVFYRLPEIQPGAEVILSSPAGEFRYIVTEVNTHPESDIDILRHGYEEKVTLITCVNDGIYDHRVVVTALPVEMTASR